MKIAPADYDRMRAWLQIVVPRVFPLEQLPVGSDPLMLLDATAAKSPAEARRGLAMMIGDLIELASRVDDSALAAVNGELVAQDLPTFAEMRIRFSKAVQRVLRRGHVKDEAEYYAVRNAAELPGADAEKLWALLGEYEVRMMPG